MDWAAQAARTADERIASPRTDLDELGGYEPTAPKLEVSAGFRFADIFFNNIFTDFAVGQQIRDAQATFSRSADQVSSLRDRLKDQIAAVAERLDAMDAERQQLLTR